MVTALNKLYNTLQTFSKNLRNRSDEHFEKESAWMPQPDTFSGSIRRETEGLKEGSVGSTAKFQKLSESMFHRYSPKSLLKILKNNHPDVSQAIWNFKIIGNCGYECKVTTLDGKTENEEGQALIEAFLRNLVFYNGTGFEKERSIDKLTDELFDSILLRGAASIEMVFDSTYNSILYFAAVDPDTINFKVENGRLIPYQQNIKLDIPTFFFEGLDETDTDPYGTSPFLGIIQTLSFQHQILNDLKMVIHNQGYGKYDLKVIEEVLLKRMPVNIRNNELKKQQWLDSQLKAIIDMYSQLDPDAAFVHYDSVQVGMVKNSEAMVDPTKIMAVIDTLILGSLKQYSTLMGRRSQGQTEQYAKMEIKIFMKSVYKVRKIIESMLSRALTKLLNINGLQGYVFFKFNDTEIRTELEKVNFEQIAILNAANKRNQGWITQDEASDEVVGHKAVGEPDLDMLGVNPDDPDGAPDERQPDDPQSSDNVGN